VREVCISWFNDVNFLIQGPNTAKSVDPCPAISPLSCWDNHVPPPEMMATDQGGIHLWASCQDDDGNTLQVNHSCCSITNIYNRYRSTSIRPHEKVRVLLPGTGTTLTPTLRCHSSMLAVKGKGEERGSLLPVHAVSESVIRIRACFAEEGGAECNGLHRFAQPWTSQGTLYTYKLHFRLESDLRG